MSAGCACRTPSSSPPASSRATASRAKMPRWRPSHRGRDVVPGWRSLPALVGAVEFGSYTRHPRLGNPGRVVWRDHATRSMQNRIGLRNPGARAAAAHPASPRRGPAADLGRQPRGQPRARRPRGERARDPRGRLVLRGGLLRARRGPSGPASHEPEPGGSVVADPEPLLPQHGGRPTRPPDRASWPSGSAAPSPR